MVCSAAEVEREKPSSSLTTSAEAHDVQYEEEAQGVLLELPVELSRVGEDVPSLCTFVSHLQRQITT